MVDFKYNPLPTTLTIQKSKIHGLGLFAKTKLDSGLNFGISHLRIPILSELLRTPLGGFVNHSENPNCILVNRASCWQNFMLYELVTCVVIEKGEELTLKYSLEQSA